MFDSDLVRGELGKRHGCALFVGKAAILPNLLQVESLETGIINARFPKLSIVT